MKELVKKYFDLCYQGYRFPIGDGNNLIVKLIEYENGDYGFDYTVISASGKVVDNMYPEGIDVLCAFVSKTEGVDQEQFREAFLELL